MKDFDRQLHETENLLVRNILNIEDEQIDIVEHMESLMKYAQEAQQDNNKKCEIRRLSLVSGIRNDLRFMHRVKLRQGLIEQGDLYSTFPDDIDILDNPRFHQIARKVDSRGNLKATGTDFLKISKIHKDDIEFLFGLLGIEDREGLRKALDWGDEILKEQKGYTEKREEFATSVDVLKVNVAMVRTGTNHPINHRIYLSLVGDKTSDVALSPVFYPNNFEGVSKKMLEVAKVI
jgi:hypothetical protein